LPSIAIASGDGTLQAPALCDGVLNAPKVAFFDWLRQFASVVTLQTQKSPLEAGSFMFGRTSQIRTGDLYHVKVAL
jgi:hypothetical protein